MAKAKKKNKKEEPVADSLSEIKKDIIRQYGNVISKVSDHEDMAVPTVSTGSISLDAALGRGGMALGRVYEVYGPNSGGKSTLAASVVKEAQKRGMRCCYVDAEHAVDPLLFKNYGVDVEALDLIQAYNGEENLDILEKYIQSGVFSVAVVDSVSSLIPSAEAEAAIGDDHIALLARLMSKALRRLTPITNRAGCLLIFINQLRMKIGTYGNPETTTGGEALNFYTTGRIYVRGPESKARRIIGPNGDVIGHRTEFEIIKNKLSAPFKKAEINLIYGKGYDIHWEVLKLGSDFGVIEQSRSWYKYNDTNLANGEMNAVAFLKENPEIYNEIREEVIALAQVKEFYEQHSR